MTQKLLIVAAVGLFLDVSAVLAQEGGDDSNLVWNAAGAAALATRAPGLLVDAGRLRHVDFLNRAFARPEISEGSEGSDLSTQLKIVFIQTLFENLNALLLGLDNLIRAQAGFAPFVPVPITPNSSTSLTG